MDKETIIFKLIDKLTDSNCENTINTKNEIDNFFIGKKVIVRTYNAGVHYGEITHKIENQVILKNSRRLYEWCVKAHGVSLSEVAVYGIEESESKINTVVNVIWLNAIELIPCTDVAIKSIENAKTYKP